MTVMLLTEYHLEFLSLKGGCTGSSESTLVKMPHRWKSHVTAHIIKCLRYRKALLNAVKPKNFNFNFWKYSLKYLGHTGFI